MEETKKRQLEAKLRAMFANSQQPEEQEKTPNPVPPRKVSVIRRRKGAPDKRIFQDLQTEPA